MSLPTSLPTVIRITERTRRVVEKVRVGGAAATREKEA